MGFSMTILVRRAATGPCLELKQLSDSCQTAASEQKSTGERELQYGSILGAFSRVTAGIGLLTIC